MRNNKKLPACFLLASGLVLSAPAVAGCAEELQSIEPYLTKVLPAVSLDDQQEAVVLMEVARATCDGGDEAAATAQLGDIKALLGLSG